MAYRRERVFTCSICGAVGFNHYRGSYLPPFWSGSKKRCGQCYCKDCTRAIKERSDELSKERDA